MTFLYAYIAGLLAASSLMAAWFYSSAPIHVFYILRTFGWKKNDQRFWDAMPHWETTWNGWADHISLALPPFFATLLTCRFCLSFHAAWIVALILFTTMPVGWELIVAGTFTWPILINILMKAAK